jgi:hypothetical protein
MYKVKVKLKQSLYRTGEVLRVPGSKIWSQSPHDSGKFVSLMHRPPLLPENIPVAHICYRLSRPQWHSAAGRFMSMKNSNDTIGNRTRTLPLVALSINFSINCTTVPLAPVFLSMPAVLNCISHFFKIHTITVVTSTHVYSKLSFLQALR